MRASPPDRLPAPSARSIAAASAIHRAAAPPPAASSPFFNRVRLQCRMYLHVRNLTNMWTLGIDLRKRVDCRNASWGHLSRKRFAPKPSPLIEKTTPLLRWSHGRRRGLLVWRSRSRKVGRWFPSRGYAPAHRLPGHPAQEVARQVRLAPARRAIGRARLLMVLIGAVLRLVRLLGAWLRPCRSCRRCRSGGLSPRLFARQLCNNIGGKMKKTADGHEST